MAKTWQVILATIVIFFAGLVTGGATAFGLAKWAAGRGHPSFGFFPPQGSRPGGPATFGTQLMKNLEKRLDLTDEQRAKIEPIIKATGTQLSSERREVQLKTAQEIEKMQDQISQVLTPEQRTKFEKLISEQRSRLRQFRMNLPPQGGTDGPNPPPPGPPN